MERMFISGHVGAIDIVQKKDGQGRDFKIAKVRVAVKSQKHCNVDGVWGDHVVTTWYKFESNSNGQAEFISKYFTVGDPIELTGKLHPEAFIATQGANAGKAIISLELQKVEDIMWCPAKKDDQSPSQPQQQQSQPANPYTGAANVTVHPDDENVDF